jgi:hypothetical protein
MTRPAADATLTLDAATAWKEMNDMKNVERALIATGVALVISGGAASAAILATSGIAAAAQPSGATQLAAQIGTNPGTLADNGPKGGADLMAAAAAYIGITAADLKTQLATGKSLADIAVANGKTRDGLIAALVAAEQQSISTFVDQKGTAFPSGPGNGGPGGPGGRFGFGVQGDPLAVAATFLGTTTADLRTKMESGQTLAQIATAAGKTRDALVQALVTDATAKIEQAKTDGKLTADQATQLESGLADKLGKLVDATEPPHGPGPHR